MSPIPYLFYWLFDILNPQTSKLVNKLIIDNKYIIFSVQILFMVILLLVQ